MNIPIIVYENGDLSIFSSISEAERALEPIDIENKEYVIYTSEGELIEPAIKEEKVGKLRRRMVKLEIARHSFKRPQELKQIMMDFLIRSGLAGEQELNTLSLDSIVQLSIDRLGYSP